MEEKHPTDKEVTQNQKNENCPCKRLHCERLGDCDACREHHRTVETRYKVACERRKRSKKTEKQ